MRLATSRDMNHSRSPRFNSVRSILSVVELGGRAVPSKRVALGSAVAHANATGLRRDMRRPVVYLVPRSLTRAGSGRDADWWSIAAGIGRALDHHTFDQDHPPACA